ncbi:Serine carboxypeptidase-like 19 [Capsicum chinense]|nr:Serine carboxypeptidase-like 19 [Capsicum chinense]
MTTEKLPVASEAWDDELLQERFDVFCIWKLMFSFWSGFSYATTVKANHSNKLQAANHAYQFLRKWSLVEHPEYLNNPFCVGGDSYSGIAVPIVTQVISDGIDAGVNPWIDRKGYILGNPETIIPDQDNYEIPFAHGMGLISDELYQECTSYYSFTLLL